MIKNDGANKGITIAQTDQNDCLRKKFMLKMTGLMTGIKEYKSIEMKKIKDG